MTAKNAAQFAAKSARGLLVCAALFMAGSAFAQDAESSPGQAVLIRNATVHTATSSGTLQDADVLVRDGRIAAVGRSEEHTSELKSLMRSSYAVFCLKNK